MLYSVQSALFILFIAAAVFSVPRFSVSPKAVDQGNSVTVTFTVSEYTDATVEVLDGSGKVIRHLVSGLLGKNPPVPLQANSLSQALSWDKKDDNGNAVSGSYDIRVGLGLAAKFDKFFGYNPQNHMSYQGAICGLTVDSLGNIYVATAAYWRGQVQITSMTRAGTYLRTLYPYPGDLPYAQTKGFGQIRQSNGKGMPVVFLGHIGVTLPEFSGFPRQGMVVSPQGWLVMANSVFTMYNMHAEGRRALIMGLDGSCPRDTFFGPRILATGANLGSLTLAVSPDGKTLYATGLSKYHCVYKSPLDYTGAATVFVGTAATAGADNAHFSDPHGIDVDASGRVYVADYMNDRIMIFDSLAAFVKSVPVARPDQIKVNRKTGEFFVLSLDTSKTAEKLIKYHALPAADSACAAPVTYDKVLNDFTNAGKGPLIALDYWAPSPIVYMSPGVYGAVKELTAYQDNGATLTALTQKLGTRATARWAGNTVNSPGYFAVDPQERCLFAGNVSWTKVDLATGAVSAAAIQGREAAFDRKGRLWTQAPASYTDTNFFMYDINGTRLTFPGGSNIFAGPRQYAWGPDFGTRGFAFDKTNRLYVFHAGQDCRAGVVDTSLVNYNRVTVYDTNLTCTDSMVVALPPSSGGVGVDNAGNIYLGYNARPKGVTYPDFCVGPYFPDPLTTTQPWNSWAYGYINYYLHQIGSLFKFPPTGGHVRMTSGAVSAVPVDSLTGSGGLPRVPPTQVAGIYHRAAEVQGPLWQYFGLTPSPASENMGDPSCQCFTSRFSVDEFGRAVIPESFRFSVAVLDANGNLITRFGEYGNADQMGEGSARPDPAIPLENPMYVATAGSHVYVSDVGSQRILRAGLVYTEWATTSGLSLAETGTPSFAPKTSIGAYPMPFRPGVNIIMELPSRERASLRIFSSDGRKVRTLADGLCRAGVSVLRWDGRSDAGAALAAGVYVLRLETGKSVYSKNLVLAK